MAFPRLVQAKCWNSRNNTFGLALNLERDSVGAVILGDYEPSPKVTKRSARSHSEVPVGRGTDWSRREFAGSADRWQRPDQRNCYQPDRKIAPGVIARQSVSQPLQTGTKAIDAMVPVGRGQRELIIGDRQTGKLPCRLDAIINQKDTGVICIYVALARKPSDRQRVRKLEEHGAMGHTIVVASSASESRLQCSTLLPLLRLHHGQNTSAIAAKMHLIVYDDLSKQAVAYRQISLLLRRPPGREAYRVTCSICTRVCWSVRRASTRLR